MNLKERRGTVLVAAWAVAWFGLAAPGRTDGGQFRRTKHGRLEQGVRVKSGVPTGSCRQCHGTHARQGTGPIDSSVSPQILGKNELCLQCHSAPLGEQWLGMNEYEFSGHGRSTEDYPRQDGRPVHLCLQCHDPHGESDPEVGLIPSMLREAEEKGCMGGGGPFGSCHSASKALRPPSAKDLESEQRKQYAHDVSKTTLKHQAGETAEAVPGQTLASERHVECVDCHNPHIGQAGLHAPGTNRVSPVLFGAFGVRPISWPPAGQAVTGFEPLRFDPRRERADSLESYLCFRCHSYYAYGYSPPPDESDMAMLFNPNNASYHPVTAVGKSPNIPSLLPPWTPGSQMYCSDCHSSDEDPTGRIPFGPHGSRYESLLRRPYSEDNRPAQREELCFLCHDPEAYVRDGRRTGSDASRFSEGGENFHLAAGHTAAGCESCHTVHGSPEYPHLLVEKDSRNQRSRIHSITVPTTGGFTKQSCATLNPSGGPGCHGES